MICMQSATFKTEMTELSNAFSKKITPETTAVYWKHLKHIDDNVFKEKCQSIIKTEIWFPPISVFFRADEEDQFSGAI